MSGLQVDKLLIPFLSCNACIQEKTVHKSFLQEAQNRSKAPGECQMSDIFGPTCIQSIGGFKYFIFFMDDMARYSHVLFLWEKGEVVD